MVGKNTHWLWAIVLAPILTILAGCGGGTTNQQPLTPIPGAQYLAEATAELSATSAPDSVDGVIWDKLVSEFLVAMEEADKERGVASVPADEFIQVDNFDYTFGSGDTVNLQWTYRNLGDYDLNGEVNVSDIVLIGRYWGAEASSDNWHTARRADGDGNGMITSGDLVPIARNYMGRVDSYKLQSNTVAGSDTGWTDVESINWLDYLAEVDRFGRAQVSYPSSLVGTNLDYRLVPVDSTAPDINTGIPSNRKTIYLTHGNLPDFQPKGQRRSRFTGPDSTGVRWIKHLPSMDLTRHPIVDGAGNFLYLADVQTLISLSPEDGEENMEYEYYSNILSFTSDGDSIYFKTYSSLNLLKPNGEVEWLDDGYGASSSALFFENNHLHHLASYYASSSQHSYVEHDDYCNKYNIGLEHYSDTELFELWSESTGHPGQQAILTDESSVLTLTTHALIKTSVDGTELWNVDLAGSDIKREALLSSGEIVLLAPETLYILSPAGEPVTNFQVTDKTPTTSESHLAINSNDEILVQVHNQLKCFDPVSGLRWEINFSSEDSPVGRPYWHLHEDGNSLFIDSSDRIYLPLGSSHVNLDDSGNLGAYAVISAEGEVLNLIEICGRSLMTPLMFNDGLMYVLSSQPDSAGVTLYCLDSSAPAPPPAPASLVASAGTIPGRIDLNWQGSNQASHYLVYRNGASEPIDSAAGETWSDHSISDGEAYSYTVVAVNPNGRSPESNIATGWIDSSPSQITAGGWSQYGGNQGNTRAASGVFPEHLIEVEPISVNQTPGHNLLLTGEDTFFGNSNGTCDLTYFDKMGRVIWEWPYTDSTNSMHPAMAADGTIYLPSASPNDGPYYLYAWNPDHTEKWKYEQPGDWFTNSPVVADDGSIYIRDSENVWHAINPDGTSKWKLQSSAYYCYQNAAIGPNGTVYVIGKVWTSTPSSTSKLGGRMTSASSIPGDRNLSAINPADGTVLWSFYSSEFELDEAPVVARVGIILVMGDSVLHAFDNTGNLLWSYDPSGYNYLIGVMDDGSSYVRNYATENPSSIHRVSPNGNPLWISYDYTVPAGYTPIDANGNILAYSANNDLVCLTPEGTVKWSTRFDNETIQGSFVNDLNELYIYTQHLTTKDILLRIYRSV